MAEGEVERAGAGGGACGSGFSFEGTSFLGGVFSTLFFLWGGRSGECVCVWGGDGGRWSQTKAKRNRGKIYGKFSPQQTDERKHPENKTVEDASVRRDKTQKQRQMQCFQAHVSSVWNTQLLM